VQFLQFHRFPAFSIRIWIAGESSAIINFLVLISIIPFQISINVPGPPVDIPMTTTLESPAFSNSSRFLTGALAAFLERSAYFVFFSASAALFC
jgi:hypothetical protein